MGFVRLYTLPVSHVPLLAGFRGYLALTFSALVYLPDSGENERDRGNQGIR